MHGHGGSGHAHRLAKLHDSHDGAALCTTLAPTQRLQRESSPSTHLNQIDRSSGQLGEGAGANASGEVRGVLLDRKAGDFKRLRTRGERLTARPVAATPSMLWKKARDALLANPKVGRSVMRTGLRNSRHGTNAACCCIILAALLFD
jgi:hypothetical protein